ncbi:MAG: DNA repair protein RadA [Acidimicrobiales bacterium]|nr:DNA repair protein RadA [Acidimicrobiales bacterium]
MASSKSLGSARPRRVYVCSSCGHSYPKWTGNCSQCREWNTLEETVVAGGNASVQVVATRGKAVPLTEVERVTATAQTTGVAELDRALSGGLVPGSVTLLGGEPGIGKSTLTMQLAASWANQGRRVLLVSAEESAAQVGQRAERLNALHDDLWLSTDAAVEAVVEQLDELAPELLIVDSIQTVHIEGAGATPGTAGQVRACAHRLVAEAKTRNMATILVGHLVKDGSLAGPKVLEHVVDTVVELSGDRHHALRLLRVAKNRFGPTDALGVFEMSMEGLSSVKDPSRLFLADRATESPGSVVFPALEGHRPLLVELQALVVPSTTPHPRRSSQGIDARRLALLLAVLERWAGLPLGAVDVFVGAVGGVAVTEPGADLPLALAVASAATGRPLNPDTVACGEVGLGGEIRQVSRSEQRLAEAHRLGFRTAVIPLSAPEPPEGMRTIRVATVAEAVKAALQADRSSPEEVSPQ